MRPDRSSASSPESRSRWGPAGKTPPPSPSRGPRRGWRHRQAEVAGAGLVLGSARRRRPAAVFTGRPGDARTPPPPARGISAAARRSQHEPPRLPRLQQPRPDPRRRAGRRVARARGTVSRDGGRAARAGVPASLLAGRRPGAHSPLRSARAESRQPRPRAGGGPGAGWFQKPWAGRAFVQRACVFFLGCVMQLLWPFKFDRQAAPGPAPGAYI